MKRTLSLLAIALFAAGLAGPAGATDALDVTTSYWTPFRDFWFESDRSELRSSDSDKAIEIANYLRRNPAQLVGIDILRNPINTELSSRRINSVRNALLQAGVPDFKIQTGAFGDPQQRRDSRVEVLVNTR